MNNLSEKYLLQIEPKEQKSKTPINDNLTKKMINLLKTAKRGRAYKGTHRCVCGERSENYDLFIGNLITNSLAVHYLKWHRKEIPKSEILKLRDI